MAPPSRPAIFAKAMADSPAYNARIAVAVETLASDGLDGFRADPASLTCPCWWSRAERRVEP